MTFASLNVGLRSPTYSADLSDGTQSELNTIANSLNNRYRRILGYKTPLEVFAELLDLEQAKIAENSPTH